MITWIKNNPLTTLAWTTALVVIGILLYAQGCALDKLIPAKIPESPANQLGMNPNSNLRDATAAFARWKDIVKHDAEEFTANLDEAEGVYTFLSSVINLGINQGSGPLSALPGGAALVTLLTTGGALFMKRPGTDKLINQEKQDSFNKGQEVITDQLKSLGFDLSKLTKV